VNSSKRGWVLFAEGAVRQMEVTAGELGRLSGASVYPSRATVTGALLVASIGLIALGGLAFWPYTVDDSYITYRYAANLAHGHGPVFNLGERVEGISNFAWMLLLAAIEWLGIPVNAAAKAFGLSAALGIVVVLYRGLVRHGCDTTLAAGACLWFAVTPTVHLYSTSGMETLPYALAVLTAMVLVAKGVTCTKEAIAVASSLALLPALRPEGIACTLLLAFWLWFFHSGRHARRAVTFTGLALAVALVARYSYYGELLPNTFVAKASPFVIAAHAGPLAFFRTLAREIFTKSAPFASSFCAPLVFALMGAGLVARPRVAALGVLVFLVGFAFVLYAPIDWMPGFRFGLPYLAPALFAAALGADGVVRGLSAHRALIAVGALAAALPFVGFQLVELAFGLTEYRTGSVHKAMLGSGYVQMGDWLNKHTAPGDVVAAYEIGALGYLGDRRIVDYIGLASPTIARIFSRTGPNEVRFGSDLAPAREVARYVSAQSPTWFFTNPSAAFDLSTPVGTPIGSKDVLFREQQMILEALEKCYGAKLLLEHKFPMGSQVTDRSVYLVLRPPVGAKCSVAAHP
jgi:arabinofuranosyltransferase